VQNEDNPLWLDEPAWFRENPKFETSPKRVRIQVGMIIPGLSNEHEWRILNNAAWPIQKTVHHGYALVHVALADSRNRVGDAAEESGTLLHPA
jgi:hypothetical protein